MSTFATINDLSLVMAMDLATPVLSLLELSRAEDRRVLQALAENPSTPPEVLRALLQRFPGEFLRNPVLPLLLLEAPDFFRRCSFSQLQALIFRADFPRAFLLDLQSHHESRVVSLVQRALLAHPETRALELKWVSHGERLLRRAAASSKATAEMLEALLCDINVMVRRTAAGNPKASQQFLSLLRRAGASEDLSSFEAPGQVSREELDALSSKGPFARALWVRHPKTPVTYAKVTSCHHDSYWLTALATRPDLPEELSLLKKYRRGFSCLDKELKKREAPMRGEQRGRRDKIKHAPLGGKC
jgi:hypothetical protein